MRHCVIAISITIKLCCQLLVHIVLLIPSWKKTQYHLSEQTSIMPVSVVLILLTGVVRNAHRTDNYRFFIVNIYNSNFMFVKHQSNFFTGEQR